MACDLTVLVDKNNAAPISGNDRWVASRGSTRSSELKLRFWRDRTEFDWRFWPPAWQAKSGGGCFPPPLYCVLESTVLLVDGEN